MVGAIRSESVANPLLARAASSEAQSSEVFNLAAACSRSRAAWKGDALGAVALPLGRLKPWGQIALLSRRAWLPPLPRPSGKAPGTQRFHAVPCCSMLFHGVPWCSMCFTGQTCLIALRPCRAQKASRGASCACFSNFARGARRRPRSILSRLRHMGTRGHGETTVT